MGLDALQLLYVVLLQLVRPFEPVDQFIAFGST
jgi:hypothetical protein